METNSAKQLLNDVKNIYLVPSREPEAIACTLALFYTLKESGKNVNLLIEGMPENLKFLTPSLDFISYPKNFVISVPSNIAKISQIFYEKTEDALKIHLTVENGIIKKDNISFYFSETKPDIIVSLGIQDYQAQLKNMDSFGFLLDAPILNIDNKTENKKFGKINLVESFSLSEIVFQLTSDIQTSWKKEMATCFMAGLILHTENFRKNVTAEIFEKAAILMKKGADIKEITNNIYGGK